MIYLRNLLLLTVSLSVLTFASFTFAQSDADQEEVVVTGSRIERPEISSNVPVTVLDRADIERTGLSNLGDILRSTPLVQGSVSNSNTSNGGDGTVKFSLRGIGTARTLILLNGRRLQPMGSGAASSPDLSAIPSAMVERVEVLKDGASAIYGSDAIAGVVNIITRDDFDGAELSIQGGASQEGDDRMDEMSFVGGVQGDRGSIVFSVSMAEKHGLLMGARGNSFYEIYAGIEDLAGTTIPGSNCPDGCDFGGSSAPPWTRVNVPGFGFATLGPEFWKNAGIDGDKVGPQAGFIDQSVAPVYPSQTDWRAFDSDWYNYNPLNWLSSPQKRWNGTVHGKLNLPDLSVFQNTKVFTEVMYSNIKSQMRIAPQPLAPLAFYSKAAPYSPDNYYNKTYGPKFATSYEANADGEGGYDLVGGEYVVNADDEGAFDIVRTLDANGQTMEIKDWRRRIVERLGRFDDRDVHNYRVLVGLEGEFGDSGWNWDLTYHYGKNDSAATAKGYFNLAKVAQQVGPTYTDDAGVLKCGVDKDTTIPSACVPLNIFGVNSVTDEMIAYSSDNATVGGLNEQEVTSVNFNGPIAEYDGGTVYMAVGYESRTEYGETLQDSLIIQGLLTDRSGLNTSGAYSLEEVYAEIIVPIYERAELQFATRSSDYSSFGTNTTSEFGFEVFATDTFTLRGSYSEAYRAPSTPALYGGQYTTFPEVTDPCAQAGKGTGETDAEYAARLATLPGCASVGKGYINEQDQSNELAGGNPALQPETAVSSTLGFVFQPTDGLDLTIDFWQVDIEETISTYGPQVLLDQCAQTGLPVYCGKIERYDTPPELKNYIKLITNLNANVGEQSYNGVDLYINYDHPDTINGWNMSLGSLVAYTAKYEETILGVATDYAGTQVETKFGLIPNIRANGFMTWSKDIYSIEYAIRYIGPAEEENYGGTMWDVDSVMYHDIRASFDFDPLTLTFGVNNLFNTEPPFVDTAFNGNTSIENYDVMGSFGYLRLTLRF